MGAPAEKPQTLLRSVSAPKGGARLWIVVIVLVLLVLLALAARKLFTGDPPMKSTADAKPGELLFDYYRTGTGLAETPGYEEITLTATEDPDKLQMDVYDRPSGDDAVVKRKTYLVSSDALRDAMKAVQKYRMPKWRDMPDSSETGAYYVCRFYWEDEFYRITSDTMPSNGSSGFYAVKTALSKYKDPALEIESPPED